MQVYSDPSMNNLVKIDANHAEFVRAMAMCSKPRRVLEFGFGAGEATQAILSALAYNEQPYEYTLVDNWLDFGGIQPEATFATDFASIRFVTSGEYEFVQGCREQYDFIFSDADHMNTEKWFGYVYENLLAPGGVLFYHDVTLTTIFPNLYQIYEQCVQHGLRHLLLNANSRPEERCDRGLLAIFKN